MLCNFIHKTHKKTTIYSRNNSATQADYIKPPKIAQTNQQAPVIAPPTSAFKPVPPPKPKNYRPPIQGNGNGSGQWDNGVTFIAFKNTRKHTKTIFNSIN